jgi:hypothetical protein
MPRATNQQPVKLKNFTSFPLVAEQQNSPAIASLLL